MSHCMDHVTWHSQPQGRLGNVGFFNWIWPEPRKKGNQTANQQYLPYTLTASAQKENKEHLAPTLFQDLQYML